MSYKHRSLDEYHIPPSLVEFMAALVKAQPGDRVLDLCWRNDDLLDAVDCQRPSGLDLWGVSSREEATNSRYKVSVSELFSEVPELMRESFDVVVVNPPWLSKPRLPESIRERSKVTYGRFDGVALCLEWSTWYLRTGGRIIAVVPGGFLSNYSSKPIRKSLHDRLQLRAVFEFTPRASIFKGAAVSTAIICLEETTPGDYQPESFMAEVADLGDLGLVSGLYEVASRATDDLVPFQIAFSKISQSYVFTCKPSDTFSPARNYVARHVVSKLARFPTERLGDIATARVGLPLRDRSSMLSHNETPYELLTGRHIASDGQITGCSFLRENAVADTFPDTFQLRTNDILVRAIQQAPRKDGHPFQPSSYEQGLVVTIVPSKYEGAFFDRSLLRIRLGDDTPAKITSQYVAQLLRNEFLLQDFNDVVLDQVLEAASSVGDSFARVVPSLIENLAIPVLPDPVIADYQERLERYFGSCWQSLSDEARLFLATGEFWYDFSKDMDLLVDFGGIAVELCKAVELEIWRRVGQHLGNHLAFQGIEKYPHWNVKKSKYTGLNQIEELGSPRAMLGQFQGFLWGIVKRCDNTTCQDYRDRADEIYAAIAEFLPQPEGCLLSGIPQLLSELIQHRNASAHKDRLQRLEMEELHDIVIPDRPEDSIIVQVVRAIPLPGE